MTGLTAHALRLLGGTISGLAAAYAIYLLVDALRSGRAVVPPAQRYFRASTPARYWFAILYIAVFLYLALFALIHLFRS